MSDQDSLAQTVHVGHTTDRESAQILMGLETVVHGLNTYVFNSSPIYTIVIIPDVFGWQFINTRLIADEIGDKTGATVYVPDFMNGDSFPLKYNNFVPSQGSTQQPLRLRLRTAVALKLWLYRHRDSECGATINEFFKNLCLENPNRRVFAAGYSWGARQAILLAGRSRSILNSGFRYVDAVYAASPLKLTFPEELHPVGKPICLALGSDDKFLSKNSIEEFKNWIGQKAPPGSEIHVYPGAPHGKLAPIPKQGDYWEANHRPGDNVTDFAVQERPGQNHNKRAAMDQAERFFNKILDDPN
ncbi:unnamed protein product [Tuber aestivum]|uniref:Dienelactone hydrolase domain-containing protein n=1 Tax=Tuber aestivum TaxID=59557 RepID=A0A292Q2V1_9PEZI|nr:unnamed protein product [Tuber aestivum]